MSAIERYQLAADNQRLREALSAIAENVDENLTESFGPFAEDREAHAPQGVAVLERARTALAATPAQALDAFTAPYEAQVATLRKAFFDLREIGKSFPAPVTHECIEPTGECYDCLRIAFDKCADALAATPAQALEASKAPLVAQVAAFDSIRSELLDIVQKYAAQSTSSDGGCTPGGLEHMGDVWTLLTRWGTVLARTPAQALDAFKSPYEARIAKLNSVVEDVWEFIQGSDGLAGWHKNGDVADWKEFDIYREVQESLAATPSDALAEYRKRVRSEVRDELLSKLLPSAWSDDTGYEMAVNMVRRMAGKE